MKRSERVLRRIDRQSSKMEPSSIKDGLIEIKELTMLLLILEDDENAKELVSYKLDEIEEYLDLIKIN